MCKELFLLKPIFNTLFLTFINSPSERKVAIDIFLLFIRLITFDQDVEALTEDLITVENGAVVSFNTVTANREYTAEIVPLESSQDVIVTIPYGAIRDLASSSIYNSASQFSTFYNGTKINVLTNPSNETGDSIGWSITNGGDGWLITNGVEAGMPAPGASDDYVAGTSYNWCYRSQTDIDLLGYVSQADLDSLPDIDAGVWLRNRQQPDYYRIIVTLKDASFATIDSWDTGDVLNPYNDEEWRLIHHTFSGYGTPVRYISYENRGKDTEFWGNQYGTIFDEAFVNILNVP